MQLMYPWFLIGMVAVAVPIIVHLLQLRRPQRVLFTNTAFIREVELVTVRHRKVQQVLILLARVLAVVALVMVFCQPFLEAAGDRLQTEAGVDVLVDDSYSMQAVGGKQTTLLGEAKEGAHQLGNAVPVSARIRLLNSGVGAMSRAVYKEKVDGLMFDGRSAKLSVGSGMGTREAGRSPLYLFSDFQKNAFSGQMLDGYGREKQVVLVPLVGQKVGNVYVDSVWLDDAFVRVRTNVGLHVRLRNGGGVAVADCPVKVFLGGRQVAAFRVTVGAGEAVASVVQVQLADGKLARGKVVTEDAPITFDNTYYFTLQPAAPIRVLEIGAEPVAQVLYGNEPLFTYSFAKPQNVDYGVMRRANLVLVREVEKLDAGLRDGLRAVVQRGGSVALVPPATAVARDSYQQLFRELGVGAAQWEAGSATPELREVAMPGRQEPFFRDVFGAQQRAVTMPRAAPVLRWARTGTDILRMRDGESYLAEFVSGAGRVYVFSAPFATQYSDFVTHALFVPVMYRMAMLSYRNEQLPAYRLTQEGVNIELPEVAAATVKGDEVRFRFVKDSLTLIPAQRLQGREVRLDVPAGMNEPGFYEVQQGGKGLTTLAFNQAKGESELAAYSADELRAMLGTTHPNVRVVEGGNAGAGLAKFQAEQTGKPLWRYFLGLALVALLAEALLVRFGKRTAKPTRAAVAA